ncbi:hypothetical protein [Fervidobacterium sp.]
MKKYTVVLIIYSVLLIFSLNINQEKTVVTRYGEPVYWFSIYHDTRIWKINTEGRIYDVCGEDSLELGPFVTGLDIDIDNGVIIDNRLKHIPLRIPEGVFEINLAEKYIVTRNSAVVYLTDIAEIQSCLNAIVITWQYLDSDTIYLYKNGKIYTIKG